MTGNKTIRQVHRWLSVIFTLTVILGFIAAAGALPSWVFYLPLPPLALQLFTGLYLFTQPYAAKWRSARRTALAE